MKDLIGKIGIVGLFLWILSSCVSTPKFEDFQNETTYSQRFLGTWKLGPLQNGVHSVMVLNENGTGSETAFDKNDVSTSTFSFRYKVNSVQFIMQIINNNNIVVWNYNFLDNDTFSLGASLGSFLYNRVGTALNNNLNIATGIEGALVRAAEEVSENFTVRAGIAIVYIEAEDRSQTDFIAGELEHLLRRKGFVIIDRADLDRIRAEQRFGLSGEVDDNTAAKIGNIAGANVVITGRVDGTGNLRRLRLRALDTSTGRVIGTASERL